MQRHRQLAGAFLRQRDFCADAGAPFYAELAQRCAADIDQCGLVAAMVGDFAGDPNDAALPLRLFAPLHSRVLAGTAPSLARHYPSAGGTPRWPDAWREFLAAMERDRTGVAAWLDHPPQTNEVGRSAALLGGFLAIAATTPGPLHLLEIGASAGLNQHWDRYGYRLGELHWGDAASPVQLRPQWRGPPPRVVPLLVADRRACDLRPIDVRDPEACARLEAFVWPDHVERLITLRAALQVARAQATAIERADAGDWLATRLAAELPIGATVVYHSSVWNYLAPALQQRIDATIAAAGARSTRARSLHRLRWEDPPGAHHHELRLESWPDGSPRVLARGQAHGRTIEWLAAGDAGAPR